MDKNNNDLNVIYPNLLIDSAYTKEGLPIVTMMQNPCKYVGSEDDVYSDCGLCKHFKRIEELLGICKCIKNKKIGDKIMKSKNVIKKIMFVFIFMLLTSKMISTSASIDNYNVIKEPTSENPTFEVEGDVTYQWYKVEESEYYTIADIYNLIDDKVNSYIYDGYYSEDKWLSDTGYINIVIGVRKDDQVKVTLNEDFDGWARVYGSEDYFEMQEDGSYVYTVTTKNSLDFEIMDNNNNPIEGTIELIRNGKVYPVIECVKVEFDEENGFYHSPDIDDGYYINGKWYSEEFEIDIEFNLEEGYTIQALVGKNFKGFAYINADDYIELDLVDGKFTYTTDGEITNFEIIIYTEDTEFDAIVNILKDDKKYVVIDDKFFYADMTYADIYVYDGYYENELWFTNEKNEIELDIYVEPGYVITVTPSDEFSGNVIIYNGNDEKILESSNGVYSYRIKDDEYIRLYLNDSKEFSSKLQIQYTTNILLESQTTKTLNPDSIGEYFVEVMFADGTKVTSKHFTVNAKVQYEEFGGSPVLDYIGSLVEESQTTTRVGYIFGGWYSDLEYSKKVEFPYEVIGINTLYAKWIKCDHSKSGVKSTCVDSVTCTECGDIYEKTGHSYKAEYTKDENSHYFECNHCDSHSKEGTHQFTDWVVTKSATREEQGLKQRLCKDCGHLESRTIEATGLETWAIIGIVLGSVSILAVAIFIVLKKKRLF